MTKAFGIQVKCWNNSDHWISKDGQVFRKRGIAWRKIKPFFNRNNGRWRYALWIKEERVKVYRYRMIWEAWKGGTKDLTIDHIDGNKTNDVLSNLQLLTREDNIRKRYLNNKEETEC
jgi:hypothetical protein